MSIAVVPFITTALSVYSLGKGLKEGNFMQAALGAFGVYAGMSNLGGATAAGGGSDTAALSGLGTEQGAMLAKQTLDFGAEGAAMTADALGGGAGLADDLMWAQQDAFQGLDTISGDQLSGVADSAQGISGAASGGVLESLGDTISGGIDSLTDFVGQFFDTKTGQVVASPTANSIQITASNLKELAPTLMKGAGMFMKYKGQEDMREEEQKRYEQSRADMERERANRGFTAQVAGPNPIQAGMMRRTKQRQAGVL